MSAVDPLSLRSFLENHWGRAACRLQPKSAVQSDAVWASDAWQSAEWLRHVDAAEMESGRHVLTRIEHASIPAALNAGRTICGDVTLFDAVQEWLEDFRRAVGLGRGGFAKLYVSPPGRGFPLHMDPHHVFVLQCRGSKRWWYGATPAVPHAREPAKLDSASKPIFSGRYEGVALHREGNPVQAPTDLQEIVLEPGDALYLPPGTWHRAAAETASIAVSISPPRITPYDLVMQWLDGSSLARAGWFEDLVVAGRDPESIREQLEGVVVELRKTISFMPADTLHKQWVLRVAEAQPAGDDREVSIEPETELERVSALPYMEIRYRDDESVVFYGGGREFALPIEARPFVEGLAEHARFRADEVLQWDPNLDWASAKPLLEQLTKDGLLRALT